LWHKYGFSVIGDDVELFVVDDEEENRKLQRENEKLQRQLENSQDVREDIKNLISDKGIDEVADIVAQLLKTE
jgi:regulator of replication initiation timing